MESMEKDRLSECKKWAEESLKNAKLDAMLIYRGALVVLGKSPEEDIEVMKRVMDARSSIGYHENRLKELNDEIAEAEAENNVEAV